MKSNILKALWSRLSGLIFSLIIFTSCQSSNGSFAGMMSISNNTKHPIWFERTEGFERDVSKGEIGSLPRYTVKYRYPGVMTFPDTIAVYWRDSPNGELRKQVISLAHWQPTSRRMPLVLEYEHDRTWQATLVK